MNSNLSEVSPLFSLAAGLILGAVVGYIGVFILFVLYYGSVYHEELLTFAHSLKPPASTNYFSFFFSKSPPVPSKKLF